MWRSVCDKSAGVGRSGEDGVGGGASHYEARSYIDAVVAGFDHGEAEQ